MLINFLKHRKWILSTLLYELSCEIYSNTLTLSRDTHSRDDCQKMPCLQSNSIPCPQEQSSHFLLHAGPRSRSSRRARLHPQPHGQRPDDLPSLDPENKIYLQSRFHHILPHPRRLEGKPLLRPLPHRCHRPSHRPGLWNRNLLDPRKIPYRSFPRDATSWHPWPPPRPPAHVRNASLTLVGSVCHRCLRPHV